MNAKLSVIIQVIQVIRVLIVRLQAALYNNVLSMARHLHDLKVFSLLAWRDNSTCELSAAAEAVK